MRDYSNWWNPKPIPKKPQQEPIQQFHYDAMYKVQLEELLTVLYRSFNQYFLNDDDKDFYKEISHEPFQHYAVNHAQMRGIVKQYGKAYRRYTLDFNGVWHEVDFSWHTGIGNEVTKDTIKAFMIEVRDEGYKLRNGGNV